MTSDKKVFIHDSVIDPGRQRGVDRCFTNFTSALVEEFPQKVYIFSNRYINFNVKKHYYPIFHYLRDPFPRRITYYLDENYGRLLADTKADIFYSPYYGKIKTKIPQVFSAHDMIYEKFPHHFGKDESKSIIQEKKECFDRASLILCVSKTTANDIRYFYPHIPENKLKVVYNGVSEFFRIKDLQPFKGKPYFLYVGNRSHYKNFLRFLTAFGKSGISNHFDLKVVSPFDDFPTVKEKEIIADFHLQNSIKVEISITDEVLRKRYQQAFAYVFPSEYEGFGLPLIEAMTSGTLVLASNTASLTEIGGAAPLYFDPYSINSMVETIYAALRMSATERQMRINMGESHSAKYSWAISKLNFLKAINSLL